ncbi:MAG: hypothetical protein JXR77_09105 [Lentisphaeria bacterium]|nr:hypothetical protein [Lentisphaeria bacterium]
MWRSPEPGSPFTRMIGLACAIWLGDACAPVASAQTDTPPPAAASAQTETPPPAAASAQTETPPPAAALVQTVRQHLDATHPGVDMAAMLDYFSRNSPDIFAEVRRLLDSGEGDPAPYLRRLADHFLRMDRVNRRNPTEFSRLAAIEQLESRARMLGRRVQELAAAAAAAKGAEASEARRAMAEARQELKSVLERAFDASQQNQRLELNRLEAELQAMRRLLEEREAKRDLILQQRFIQLSGQEMTDDPAPMAKGSKAP